MPANYLGYPGLTWGNATTGGRVNQAGSMTPRGPVVLPRGKAPRWVNITKYFGGPRSVLASVSQMGNPGRVVAPRGVKEPGYGTQGPNVINPMFGRPGFSYTSAKPLSRIGPSPKLAPGTGLTGVPQTRSDGFVPGGFQQQQYIDVNQFDYLPATDPTVDQGHVVKSFPTIPRTIGIGDDGIAMLGTYRAHDFVIPSRFFEMGRSAGYWQDQSFGPEYRYLIPAQQVARYNLYTDIALARQLSPNAYFLPYQTQPAVASQIMNGNGLGRPLGY